MSEAMKVWPRLSNYPGLTLKATISSIICFGYKELGDKKAKCKNAWDFDRWVKDVNDDYDLVKFAFETLQHADVVVTQNGKAFDWKFLQTRLLYHKLPPLPKIQHIDTKLLAKRNLYLFSNSLEIMAKFLTNTEKMDNGGWDLWVKVSNKDPNALKVMSKYCKQDVEALEAVFNRLRPFVSEMPNYNLFRRDAAQACPNCGSFGLKKDGTRAFKTKIVQRLRCNECGTSMQESIKDKYPKTI
jgi:DNA polymerase elongation subunit (family B)